MRSHRDDIDVNEVVTHDLREELALGKQALREQGLTIIRLRFALKMLSAWSGREGQYDGEVVGIVSEWVKAGMVGPVPWPGNPFFGQWAKQQGWSNVGGFVGFRFAAAIVDFPSPEIT